MNYIKELRAFKDWLLLNELPTSAIALWHTLMSINNMTGWKSTFNAPNSVVEKLTGLSKQGLVNARIKLIEEGLIEYEKGKKGKAPSYKMASVVALVNSFDQFEYQSEYQSKYQSEYQCDTQSLTIPKQKHKQNKKEAADACEDAISFYTNNFGFPSPFIQESIEAWVNDFSSEEIVIAAMKMALKKGGRTFAYCESFLREWEEKGLKTIGAVRTYESSKKGKKQSPRKTMTSKNEEVLQKMREKWGISDET